MWIWKIRVGGIWYLVKFLGFRSGYLIGLKSCSYLGVDLGLEFKFCFSLGIYLFKVRCFLVISYFFYVYLVRF